VLAKALIAIAKVGSNRDVSIYDLRSGESGKEVISLYKAIYIHIRIETFPHNILLHQDIHLARGTL
jgi:hypothetical protein